MKEAVAAKNSSMKIDDAKPEEEAKQEVDDIEWVNSMTSV